jgi:hypothetical protein
MFGRALALGSVAVGVAVLLAAGLMVAVGASQGATKRAAPAGPRLAVIASTRDQMVLQTIGPDGGNPLRLAGGGPRAKPYLDEISRPAWSADGTTIAFAGIVGFRKRDDHEPIRRLFAVGADGSGLRPIAGTNGATSPVFAPEGHTVAFTRSIVRETRTTVGGKVWMDGFIGTSLWTVDLDTGTQRQLTPWQDGLAYGLVTLTRDGSALLAVRADESAPSESGLVAVALDGSGVKPLPGLREYRSYSPDGSKFAVVRRVSEKSKLGYDVFVISSSGGDVRRVTYTEDWAETFPSWDPSGERLALVRFQVLGNADDGLGIHTVLIEVNADGTCPTKVALRPAAAVMAPSWQPGPGREAGRIEC